MTQTKIRNWVPAIRKRMKELGLNTYDDLWKRVQPIAEKYPDSYSASLYYEVSNVVRQDKKRTFIRRANDYTLVAYTIAIALGSDVEDLFGPVPKPEPQYPPTAAKILNDQKKMDSAYQDFRSDNKLTPSPCALAPNSKKPFVRRLKQN